MIAIKTISMLSILDKFIKDAILQVVANGGELVDKNEEMRRRYICSGCPYFGDVQPLPILKMKGCIRCGCPIDTKAKVKRVVRMKDAGDNLSAKEIAKIMVSGETEMRDVTCPHPDGDKWKI